MQDTLYLLGSAPRYSPARNTTEKHTGTGQEAWTGSFDLQTVVGYGCAVKVNEEEIMTIAGDGERSRKMFKYNVRTGDAVEYNDLPPTPVTKPLNH